MLPRSDVLGEQYSAVNDKEPQIARRFRPICRRCGPLRDLPAQVSVLNVDDTLRDDLGRATCRRWLIGQLPKCCRELRRAETYGERGNGQDDAAREECRRDSPRRSNCLSASVTRHKSLLNSRLTGVSEPGNNWRELPAGTSSAPTAVGSVMILSGVSACECIRFTAFHRNAGWPPECRSSDCGYQAVRTA